MYKWGAAPSPNCECGASEQTADHIISTCPLRRVPKGIQGLLVLDDDTDAGLKSTPSTSKPSEKDAQPHDEDEVTTLPHITFTTANSSFFDSL